MRYFMTFAYDGSKFNGYQKQPNSKTVQGEIEKALKEISGEKISICASGRTDALVHALNQKAHFDLEMNITSEKLKKALNSKISKSIYIKNIEEVNEMFHARFNVKAKEYIYKINMGEYDPIEKDYVFQYNKRLDVVAMERALKYIEGTHDFTSFTKASDVKENCERTIVQTNLIRNLKDVNKITISFLGTGFMRYMIRNIIGVLLEIGEGRLKSEDIITILEAKDRRKAGITAKPEGLYLKNVFY